MTLSINSELFSAARLKVERAGKHINDLNIQIREFQKSNPYEIQVEYDPRTGNDFLKFVPTKGVPGIFMCIAGDALHNLRSALDFAISDIEFATTGKRTSNTNFPVRPTRNELVSAINGGLVKKAPNWVINFIVDVIQPYKGGNGNAIWAIHSLDIEDKHRLLIPHLQLQFVRNIRYKDETGEIFTFPDWAAVSGHMPRVPTDKKKVEVKDKGTAALGIVFGRGMPMDGQPILPTLHGFAVLVGRTLDSIERVFLSVRP